MRPAAIELHQVAKRFQREKRERRARRWWPGLEQRFALRPLDLSVEGGRAIGVIGPNGSGKSTLVRILSTLLLPDSGYAKVFGNDVVREAQAVKRHINRVSVEASFFKELSPWENLVFSARLYGTDGPGTRTRVERILEHLGLPRRSIDTPLRHLSRGQQQKVAIARCLLTTPSLLLMDEPTTGLDPRSRREVQQLLQSLRKEREVTSLLCTHDMEEAETLCERILLMDRGRVLADGTPAELGPLEELFFRLSGRALAEADETEEPDRQERLEGAESEGDQGRESA
jgi:ABC-2 type transport system ATP-binding protein